MKRRLLTGWACSTGLILAIAFVASGCGGGGSKSATLSANEFAFLTDSGQVTPESPEIEYAQQILIKSCVERQGFKYSLFRPPRLDVPVQNRTTLYIPGVGANATPDRVVAERRKSGYGLFAVAGRQQSKDTVDPGAAERTYLATLSPAEQKRYQHAMNYGPPTSVKWGDGGVAQFKTKGCTPDANRTLYGSPVEAERINLGPETIREQLAKDTQKDPALVLPSKRWRACVAKATGESFDEPHDIIESLQQQYDKAGTSGAYRVAPTEIRWSVADAQCQFSSGVAKAYATRFRYHADHLPESAKAELFQYLQVQTRAYGRAQKLISKTGLG